MNHSEFTKKWYGKSYAETPELGVQCVGGVKLYCKERKLPIGSFGGSAINGWTSGMPFDNSWVRVEYKPGMFPKQGDILFWSEKRCKYGHTAVGSKYCNKDLLRYFDQNGTGHGDVFTPRFTDYKFLLGWFTCK